MGLQPVMIINFFTLVSIVSHIMAGCVVIFAIGCDKSVRETLGYILPNEELWSSMFPSVDDERDRRQKEHMMRGIRQSVLIFHRFHN